MDERDRNELERIQKEHAQLHARVYLLGQQLKELESRVAARKPTPAPLTVAPPASTTPPHVQQPATLPTTAPITPQPPQPPPLIIPKLSTPTPQTQASPVASPVTSPANIEAGSAPAETAAAKATAPEQASRESSIELRFGTYWAVRAGIVMVLTALAFFGYYAYQNYIPHLGPWGKVLMLYLGSGALLGAGAWFQRKKGQDSLKNYGQVLFAGGLAAVYFTTYAAHHIPALKVIQSAIADGALLLGWAGFIVWLADRRKSETLSLFAIGLAYYTSVITDVGLFTLYSNLVLTLAAVFFLVRNRWATLSFASLVATYAGYGYWRFFQNGAWLLPTSPTAEHLWIGVWFLAGYWIAFTAAVFLSRHAALADGSRATFLSFNNGAFFGLVVMTMLNAQRGAFWKFSLVFGVLLLALA
ncbi:MAG: DUF2339 domain-containing protein, partial [Pedosphaera parvula]|nr:DUF2339 domain-containing protein [Pedosphaera parvula]